MAEHQRLAQLLMQDKPFFDMGGGVTFSGGECMLQWEFLYHTAQLLRQEGVGVDIDTCGHAPWEAFEALLPLTDWFLYDFKAFDPEVHKQCTGVENGLIKENLERLSRAGASVEIRFPLVMGYNDSQLAKTARYLSGLRIEKVKILPFHDYSHSKYEALGMEDALPSHDSVPTRQDLCRAASAFEQHGIRAEVSG